jgi:broad specificity phosphatase PhoE
MKLFLVRHCQTDWNLNHKIQGNSDVRLNEQGLHQSAALAIWFQQFKIDAIYSSPKQRALETARKIAEGFNMEVQILEGLQELNHGNLEGESSIDVWNRHGELLKRWLDDPLSIRLPGGESISDLRDRVWDAVNYIIKKHPDDNVIAIGHHFTNLVIISMAIGLDLRNIWRLKQDESAVNLLVYNEFGWRLIYCNSLAHLNYSCQT